MEKEILSITNGTFTLTETEDKNQFYFYRNDGGTLGDLTFEPLDMYEDYLITKIVTGEIRGCAKKSIKAEISKDEKTIRLTVSDAEEEPRVEKDSSIQKKPNLFKRLLHKIFG